MQPSTVALKLPKPSNLKQLNVDRDLNPKVYLNLNFKRNTTGRTVALACVQSDISNVFSAEVSASALRTLAALPPHRFADMLVAEGDIESFRCTSAC